MTEVKPDVNRLDILLHLIKRESGESGIPLKVVRERLSQLIDDSARADQTIQEAVDAGLVEPVVDYERLENASVPLFPSWHLKLLTHKEQSRLRQLPASSRALLNILWQQHDPKFPGWIQVDEALSRLRAMQFAHCELENPRRGILDRVDQVARGFAEDTARPIWWYRIIPEYERNPSQQYLVGLKSAEEEFMRKQLRQEAHLEETGRKERKRPE